MRLPQWLSRWLGSRAQIEDPAWDRVCHKVALLRRYSETDRARLRALAEHFLQSKRFESPTGLELDFEMRLVISAMACVPVLGLGRSWLHGWISVIIYPDEFVARHDFVDNLGLVHRSARALIGEAWHRGPLILSWRHCLEAAAGSGAHNVIIHELAHKLDLANGVSNGMPPLHADMRQFEWSAAFGRAYVVLRRRLERGEISSIDAYATEDPAEFFAVLSELFFMRPHLLLEEYPAVYRQLELFYRQDPARA